MTNDNSVEYSSPTGGEEPYKRVIWQSRRGMLELDLVLEPFVKLRYPDLSAEDRAAYRNLLRCDDQSLFDWFMGKARPDDLGHADMVDTILAFQRSRDLRAAFD